MDSKTIGKIGERVGLNEGENFIFVRFFGLRFPDEQSKNYVCEWANRFVNGTAYEHADSESSLVLAHLGWED